MAPQDTGTRMVPVAAPASDDDALDAPLTCDPKKRCPCAQPDQVIGVPVDNLQCVFGVR